MGLPPFQTFLDAHREEVYRFLHGVVGPHDADDCFQETFLSALRAYDRASAKNLRAWIMTIAYRKAMDEHRARKRRPVPLDGLPERPARASQMTGVWEEVKLLPPKQRAAIVHRYGNDLAYRDIAEIAGCSEEAARQNVREGLKKLKEWAR